MSERAPRSLLLRPPLRGRLALCVAMGAAVGVIAWYFGMDVAHAIALGLVVSVVAAVLGAVPEHRPADWARERGPAETGIRRDVSHLSWSLHSRSGAVAASAHRRLRDLARTVLARHELDLDEASDAAASERLLGAAAWNTIRPGERALPHLAEVEATLDALQKLDLKPAESEPVPEEPR
ncbi:hypothetical protein ACPPVQ_11275 [Diaminobutyricibacter sp. McL0618]|uniref:hypothetical protein n=1 Tax=Leifsonia sp. McL0618 TaxID=3415677 RepID=UPI003CF09DF3